MAGLGGKNFEGSDRAERLYRRLAAHRATIEAERQRVAIASLRQAYRLITQSRNDSDDPRMDSSGCPTPTWPSSFRQPARSWTFARTFTDVGEHVLVEPSYAEGFFYVTVVRYAVDLEYGDNYFYGTKRPLNQNFLRAFISKTLNADTDVLAYLLSGVGHASRREPHL